MTEPASDSERLLRHYIALATGGMALTDTVCRVVEWNAAWEALSGLSRESVVGRPLWEVQHDLLPRAERTADQLQRLRVALQAALETGAGPGLGEPTLQLLHRPDGQTRRVETRLLALPQSGGHVLVYAANAAAEPEEQLAAALAAGSRILHGLVEHATDGILLADEQGLIIEWNKAEERLTGLTRAEVVGRPVWEVLYELLPAAERTVESRQRIHEYLRHAVTTGELRGTAGLTERHVLLPDGGDRWLHSLSFTIPTGRGHVLGRISRDITDRKRAEAELLQRNRQLEILSETSQQINAVLEARVVLRTLVLAATDALGAAGGAAGLVQGDRVRFSEAWVRGQVQAVDWSYQRGQGPAGSAWRTVQPYVQPDAQADPHAPPLLREALGAYDLVSVPLVGRDGQVLGCLEVYHEPAQWPFEPDAAAPGAWQALGLLRGLAAGAATALENAHLLAESERAQARAEQSVRRLTSLRAVDTAINASLNLGVTLQVVLEHAQEHLGLDAATVLVANPARQTLEFAASRGFAQPGPERNQVRYGEGLAGRAVLERRLVSAGDLVARDSSVRRGSLLADYGFVTYYAMPLLAKGEVKGVLELFGRQPHTPDPDWMEFLEIITGQAALAIDGAQLFTNLQRANFDLSLAYDATIEGWARALDLREHQPAGQSQRLAQSAERLGRALGLAADELTALRRGALLHDIGHVAIPDEILNKAGPLTAEEWDVMQQHPAYAQDLLAPITFLRAAIEVPYAHHERWDGSGYPRQLKGDEIPFLARIFAVADVWDALRSPRPHRAAWPADRARAYLREQAGQLFDPRVVEAFLQLV